MPTSRDFMVEGGFEEQPSTWAVADPTWAGADETTYVRTGTYAGRIQVAKVFGTWYAGLLLSPTFTVPFNTAWSYTLNMWILPDYIGVTQVNVAIDDGRGFLVARGAIDASDFSGTGWQKVSIGPFTPEGATWQVQLTGGEATAASGAYQWYFDDISVDGYSQYHPSPYGPEGYPSFHKWGIDDIMGSLVRGDRTRRDATGALRDGDDVGSLDRDDLLAMEEQRVERTRDEL